MYQTKWHQPWAGLCPVSGLEVSEEPINRDGIIFWRCEGFNSIGRVLKREGEQDVIFLDNPEIVYSNYPEERTITFTRSKGPNDTEEYEIRESHLLPHEIDLLVADTVKYVEEMPESVVRRIRMHFRS